MGTVRYSAETCLVSYVSHAPGDSVETFHSTLTGCQRTPLLGAAFCDYSDCDFILPEQVFCVNAFIENLFESL